MDLGYGVGETRVVSVAGGRKLRRCGSIRGDIYGLGEEKGAFDTLGKMWWEGEGMSGRRKLVRSFAPSLIICSKRRSMKISHGYTLCLQGVQERRACGNHSLNKTTKTYVLHNEADDIPTTFLHPSVLRRAKLTKANLKGLGTSEK